MATLRLAPSRQLLAVCFFVVPADASGGFVVKGAAVAAEGCRSCVLLLLFWAVCVLCVCDFCCLAVLRSPRALWKSDVPVGWVSSVSREIICVLLWRQPYTHTHTHLFCGTDGVQSALVSVCLVTVQLVSCCFRPHHLLSDWENNRI